MLAIGSLVGLAPTISSGLPASDVGAGAGFDGLLTSSEAIDLTSTDGPAQGAVVEAPPLADGMAATQETAEPDATPLACDLASDCLPDALPALIVASAPPPVVEATVAAAGDKAPTASRSAMAAVLAVGANGDAPEAQPPSVPSDDQGDASAIPVSADAGPDRGSSKDNTVPGGAGTGRPDAPPAGTTVKEPPVRTDDAAPADPVASPRPTGGREPDRLSQSGRMQATTAGDAARSDAGPVIAAEQPAALRKLARSSRLSIERAVPTSDATMNGPARGESGTAKAPDAGQPAQQRTETRPADRQAVQPDAPPRDPDTDARVVRADGGEAMDASPPHQSTDRPVSMAQSFEAILSKASAAPPQPRSPLVQAAVERLTPLPAAAGETVLRLNPHGLGLIEVVIHDGRNGALDVALRVQNPLVLDAMRQERDAVAVVFSASQGGAEGSLSMDLMQSGTRQGGGGEDARRQPQQTGQLAPESWTDEAPDAPEHQVLSADRVNIVT